MQRKAMILGVSGQDGTYLSQLLLEKGYHVAGTSRNVKGSQFSGLQALGILDELELFSVSLRDFRSTYIALKEYKPTEVYNLAGQTSVGLSFHQPVETFESIAIANLNILEALRMLDFPVRYYNACSSDCFGNTGGLPASESTPFMPRSPYAVAKASAFWQVANYREAYAMYACSGICFNHESPLRSANFVTHKIVATAVRIARGAKETLHLGNLEVRRDWGWAPEYVAAMHQLLQVDEPADCILATGRTHSLTEFVALVFTQLGLHWEEHVVSDPSNFRPTDVMESKADPSFAHKLLGWKAKVLLPELVARLVEAEQRRQDGKSIFQGATP